MFGSRGPIFAVMPGGTDFSLVNGGPLVALMRRLGWRRADGCVDYLRACIVLVAVAWGPLMVAMLFARLTSGQSFAIDWSVHIRLLVAIPLLLRADVSLHARTRFVVDQFVADRWAATQQERFDGIVARAIKHRDAIFPEVLLLCLALLGSELVVWNSGGMPYLTRRLTIEPHLHAARWWYALVGLPLFQFLVYRALWRWAIWVQVLWRLSRLRLQPTATHPDLAGGLEFLSWPSVGFGHVIAALTATQAGVWANQVLYAGVKVLELKSQALVLVVASVVLAMGPLLFVAPRLWRCKVDGQHQYGSFATDYTRLFEERWLARRDRDEVLGSGDIQSLADLANAYQVVTKMRLVPFGPRALIAVAAAAFAPLVPVALLGVPLSQILSKLAGTLIGKPG